MTDPINTAKAARAMLAALRRFVSLRDSGLLIESDGYMCMVLDEALAAIAAAKAAGIKAED